MPAERPRLYWDTNVFLSYIDGDADRLPTLDELLRQSRAGEIELVTSVLTQVEVAYASREKASEALESEIEERIDELWVSDSPVTLVELYPAIASEARGLMRRAVAAGRSGLSAGDAIHLATANRMAVADFHTYDRNLDKHGADVPFPIRAPQTPQEQLPGT